MRLQEFIHKNGAQNVSSSIHPSQGSSFAKSRLGLATMDVVHQVVKPWKQSTAKAWLAKDIEAILLPVSLSSPHVAHMVCHLKKKKKKKKKTSRKTGAVFPTYQCFMIFPGLKMFESKASKCFTPPRCFTPRKAEP